ncbi:MAG: hypothetical protein ABIH48_01810 [Candidatus Falkowbacteria bacterium]
MRFKFNQLTTLFHVRNADFKTGILELYNDNKTRLFIIVALIINILAWIASIFFNANIEEKIIALHHNIYFGISLIGGPKQVFFIPLLGLIIIIVNTIFSYLIRREDNFFVYLFTASTILINIFLLLGLGSIILINFR